MVIGTGVALVLVDKFGRKILLVISAVLMGVSIATLGAFFYLKEHVICDGKV